MGAACYWPKLMDRSSNPAWAIRRVFLFLHTDDFQRDYQRMQANGVQFVREPAEESYGTVAVFEDLYGNRWDLVQPK